MSEPDDEDFARQAMQQVDPLRGKPVPELAITPSELRARAAPEGPRRVLKIVGETTVGVCAAGLALATLAWFGMTVTAAQGAWVVREVAIPALLIALAAGYLLAAIGRGQIGLGRRKGLPVRASRADGPGGDASGSGASGRDDAGWQLTGIAAVQERTYRITLCAPGGRVHDVDVVLESASMTGGLLPRCVAYDKGLLPAAVNLTVMGALWAFHNASQAPEPIRVIFRADLPVHRR